LDETEKESDSKSKIATTYTLTAYPLPNSSTVVSRNGFLTGLELALKIAAATGAPPWTSLILANAFFTLSSLLTSVEIPIASPPDLLISSARLSKLEGFRARRTTG
jgi:hypothetical protein